MPPETITLNEIKLTDTEIYIPIRTEALREISIFYIRQPDKGGIQSRIKKSVQNSILAEGSKRIHTGIQVISGKVNSNYYKLSEILQTTVRRHSVGTVG